LPWRLGVIQGYEEARLLYARQREKPKSLDNGGSERLTG
jgi:hypothetical protein